MAWCFLLKRDMLVWVDETSSDSRDNVLKVWLCVMRGTVCIPRTSNKCNGCDGKQWNNSTTHSVNS